MWKVTNETIQILHLFLIKLFWGRVFRGLQGLQSLWDYIHNSVLGFCFFSNSRVFGVHQVFTVTVKIRYNELINLDI